MLITAINPKFVYPNNVSFKEAESKLPSDSSATSYASKSLQSDNQKKGGAKGFLAGTAYAWVNFSEMTKGLLKGLFWGFVGGTVVAGANMVPSGFKKYFSKSRPADFEFKHILSPKKAMTRKGKIWSWAVAGTILAANLIIARLKTNKRTSNVDHMLYEGHRDK